jgi:predicted RNase H-like HicB family nuclease
VTNYIALVRKDPDSDFGVDFPDFPGCVSAGATVDEARRMAQEAFEFHVRGMVEDGDELPVPSSLDRVMAEPANGDVAEFFFVTLPDAAEPRLRTGNAGPKRALRR